MEKRLSWALGIAIALLVFVYSIPFVLSTDWASRYLLSTYSRKIEGRWEADRITLRWFGRQQATNLRLYGIGPEPILQVEQIDTGLNLWNLLWGHLWFGKTEILRPELYLAMDHESSNLEDALRPLIATSSPESIDSWCSSGTYLSSARSTDLPSSRCASSEHHLPRPLNDRSPSGVGKKEKPATPSKKRSAQKSPLRFRGDFTVTEGSMEVFGPSQATLKLGASANLIYPSKGRASIRGETFSRSGAGSISGTVDWSRMTLPKLTVVKQPLPSLFWEGRGSLTTQKLPAPVVEALLRLATGKPGLSEIFGQVLDLKVEGAFENERGAGKLSASSNTLTCELECALEEKVVSLTKPAQLSLNLVPALFRPLLDPYSVELTQPGRLEVVCDTYTAIVFQLGSPLSLALQGSAGPLAFWNATRGGLTIGRAALNLKKASGSALQGSASVDGKDFAAKGVFSSMSDWTLEAKSLPLPWIDPFLAVPLTPYLGTTLSCKVALDAEQIQGEATTPWLDLPQTTLFLGETITLPRPASFSYRLPPTLFPLLAEPAPLDCLFETFSMPSSVLRGAPFDPSVVTFHGRVGSKAIELGPLPLLGACRVEQFLFGWDGLSLADGRLEWYSYIIPNEERPFLSPALPLTVNGLFTMSEDYKVNLPRFQFALNNRYLEGNAIATYTYPDTFGLLFPSNFNFVFSPEQFPTLAGEGTLACDFDPSEVVWSRTQAARAHLSARLTLPRLELKGEEGVESLDGVLSLAGTKDQGLLTLKADTFTPSAKSGPLSGRVNLQGLFTGAHLRGDAQLKAPALPSNLITLVTDALPPQQLVGPLLKIDAKGHFMSLKPFRGDLDVRAEGELLKSDVGLKIGQTLSLLSKSRPVSIAWTATPAGFDALYRVLNKSPPLSLHQPATLSAQVSALNFPLTHFDPTRSTLVASAGSTPLNLSRKGKSALLENLALKVESKNLSKAIYSILKGTLTAQTKGSFEFEASSRNLFSETGHIAAKEAAFEAKGELKNLQIPYLFDLLPFNTETLGALLGNRVSGNLQAKVDRLSGPCSAQLDSENSTLALDGSLKRGVLHLNRSFQASLQVTPEIGSRLLKLANPLFLSAVRSEKPVTLSVGSRDFALPLFPFEPTKISGHGQLNLGKLWLTNRDPFALLLSLFQKDRFGANVLAWSTPLYFSISDGLMSYERMDTLFGDALHTAFWGMTELPSLRARMNLAIFPDSLTALLMLPSPPTSPLIIPFRGTLTNLSADWKQAAAGIAALAAKQQGKAGKIVGGVLDIVSGKAAIEIPPPTTTPFPWE